MSTARLSTPDLDATGLAAAIHRTESRLASIRLAVSAMNEGELTADDVEWMLGTIESEVGRISSELGAAKSLLFALTDRAAPVEVDLGETVDDAAHLASSAAWAAGVAPGAVVRAWQRAESLERVMYAVFRLLAAEDVKAEIDVATHDGEAVVHIRCESEVEQPTLVLIRALVAAVGGTVVSEPPDLGFTLGPGGGS